VIEHYYFEDFAVGQIFRSDTATLNAEAIKAFAAEFDPQPAHLDENAAANGAFRGLAASGWHTAAMVMRLNVNGGLPPIAGGIVGTGVERLAWIRPVRPGDRLRVENEVTVVRRSRTRPERGLVSLLMTAFNQDDKPVLEMIPTLLIPCRDPG